MAILKNSRCHDLFRVEKIPHTINMADGRRLRAFSVCASPSHQLLEADLNIFLSGNGKIIVRVDMNSENLV